MELYPVTEVFHERMKAPVRRVLAKVAIDYTDPIQDQAIEVTASERANASFPEQTADSATRPTHKWASLDGAWTLDGTFHLAPLPEHAFLYQMGWWSARVANQDGTFAEPYPKLTVTHPLRPVDNLLVAGDSLRGEWPTAFRIRLYAADGTLLRERVVTGNTEVVWSEPLEPVALDVARQELEIMAWSRPGSHAKILEFFLSLQETYLSDDLVEVRLLEESESGSGSAGLGGAVTNELTVRLVNRGGRFDVTNPDSPLRELLRPNRRVRAWLGVEGAKHLWGEGWYAPFDRDLTLSRQNGMVIEPLPDHVVTLRPGEGRFGGAVAVEEGTTNYAINGDFATGDFTGWDFWRSVPSGGACEVVSPGYSDDYCVRLYSPTDSYSSFGILSGYNMPVSQGDAVTFQFKYKGIKPNYVYIMRQGTTNIRFTPQDVPLKNGWRLATYTWVSDFDGNIGFLIAIEALAGETFIDQVQYEKKSFPTSFVDGTRAVGKLMYPGAIPSNEGTLLIWAKKNTLEPNTENGYRKILDAQFPRIDFQWDISGHLSANFGGANLRIPDPAQDLDWHQYAITYSDRTVKMYFDGQLVASGQAQEDLVNFSELCVGARWDGYGAGNALYDELLLLPYAASDEIIAELYRETRPLYDEWVPLGVFWSTDWDSEELEAMVRARDRMEVLRRTTYEPGLLKQNVSLYELAQDVLTHAKMPPETYWLDPGLQDIVVPWGWVPPGSHRDALRIIAEAGLARAYCDRDGILRIRRLTTGQRVPLLDITLDDYFPPMRSPSSSVSVANRVVVTTSPLAPAGSPEEVAHLTVEVPAGQTVMVRVPYEKIPVISPSATVVNPSPGISIVSATYGAASAEIQIRNASGNAATVTLSISGVPLSAARGEQVAVEDERSIRDLFLIEYQAPSNPLVQTRDLAEAIAQAILVASSRVRRQVELDWRGNPALEAGDCVRIMDMPAEIVRQELEWMGALSARITARRLS